MVSQQVLRKVSNIDDPNRFDPQNILRHYILKMNWRQRALDNWNNWANYEISWFWHLFETHFKLPDVWAKSSVPRIAKFIDDPVYESAHDISPINESFPDDFEFGVATRGVEIESNGCQNNIWNLNINNPLWSPPGASADAQVKGVHI